MATWYMTGWRISVSAIEVDSFTEKTVMARSEWSKGFRRRNRMSSYECYFPTEREAWEFLKGKAERSIKSAQDSLHRARTELGQIESALEKLQEKTA